MIAKTNLFANRNFALGIPKDQCLLGLETDHKDRDIGIKDLGSNELDVTDIKKLAVRDQALHLLRGDSGRENRERLKKQDQ